MSSSSLMTSSCGDEVYGSGVGSEGSPKPFISGMPTVTQGRKIGMANR